MIAFPYQFFRSSSSLLYCTLFNPILFPHPPQHKYFLDPSTSERGPTPYTSTMDRLIRRHNTDPCRSSKGFSRRSDESYNSQSTAPTSVYDSPRPSLQHAVTATSKPYFVSYDAEVSPATSLNGRSSTSTYASTTEDLYDEPETYEAPQYEAPEYNQEIIESMVQASTPQDFAQLFPSQRRLYIRHDDTAEDGNMNLRVDTEVTEDRYRTQVQLFHLRMHDLKARQFSLRRYCRDSGREVCHSSRRYAKPASERPGIQRSVSNALASFRSKPEFKRTNSDGSLKHNLKRQDSGYASNGNEDDDDVDSFMSSESKSKSILIPTNTTKLEFSNYAQVDVKRRGAKSHKRYEFEYWGSNYAWKRVCTKHSSGKSISFHLIKDDSGPAIAHIVPELRSHSQIRAEEEAGGWVPPCSMWISDVKVLSALTDVAE
jgi:hypothetical protein